MTRNPIARYLRPLVTTAALSFVIGCSPEAAPSLRLGINPWPGYEFLYLAQEKGFYRDEGLDLRIVEFSCLSDARRSYERGQIDVIATTVIDVLQIRDNCDRSPQIVQVVDYSDGADVILARAGIADGVGLRGARIAIEPASLGGYVLGRALEKNGLTLADVRPVPMDQVSMLDVFRKGEADAVVSYPPTSIRLLRDGAAHKIFSTADIPGEVLDVIAVEAEINARRPADIAKLLRAYHRAVAYRDHYPDDADRIMAGRENITPAEFREALTGGTKRLFESDQADYLRPGGKLTAAIDTCDRLMRQSGQIKGADRRSDAFTAIFVGKEPPL
ncbi:MAG: ABC transporter substrate-binding protein [Deltaproteobacteria bacterium]|nr:ABC transporter substrate-binding protein [Deltaproteobacteria bacterium]